MGLRSTHAPSQFGTLNLPRALEPYLQGMSVFHAVTLPQAKSGCNRKLCRSAMDDGGDFGEALLMAKAPKTPRPRTRAPAIVPREPTQNYLAEWMALKGVKAADLYRSSGVSESQISWVINGGRRLGVASAKKIAEAWGMNYLRLYEPPSVALVDLSGLSPEDLAAIASIAATLRSRHS